MWTLTDVLQYGLLGTDDLVVLCSAGVLAPVKVPTQSNLYSQSQFPMVGFNIDRDSTGSKSTWINIMCHLIRRFAYQRIAWLAFQDLKIIYKVGLCKIRNVTRFLCFSKIVPLKSVCLQKCEGVLPVEFRSFAVDPQITSLEVLQHILIRAFELNGWVWNC